MLNVFAFFPRSPVLLEVVGIIQNKFRKDEELGKI
jgi:hypothetical protein